MEWGLHQGKGLDTDMTDEAAWQARPEFAAKSAARMAKEAKALTRANTANAKSLQAASHTVLDTDHTDEEAWQARKELRKQSKARKKAEAKALAAKNRAIFKKISSTTTSDKIDDDLTDEVEWQSRPNMAKLSLVQRTKESVDLEVKNAEIRSRLKKVKPKIEITSEKGIETYRDGPSAGNWIEAMTFQSVTSPERQLTLRSRDKYSPLDDRGTWLRTDADPKTPSWLRRCEKYDYSVE